MTVRQISPQILAILIPLLAVMATSGCHQQSMAATDACDAKVWARKFKITQDFVKDDVTHVRKGAKIELTSTAQDCVFDGQLKGKWGKWQKRMTFNCKWNDGYMPANFSESALPEETADFHVCTTETKHEAHDSDSEQHIVKLFPLDPSMTKKPEIRLSLQHEEVGGGVHGGYAHGVED